MRIAVVFALQLFLLGLSSPTSVAAGTAESTMDKARLQAAMQKHIERQMVGDAILHLDVDEGKVKALYPTQAHPMILKMGEHFVLCSDLKDEAGRSLPIDLYMAQRGKRFVVFHTEIGNRAPLKTLMSRGLVKPLR